jgi:iron complex outermembrane recepter protein
MKKICLLILLMSFLSLLNAQEYYILEGFVKDVNTGQKLEYANIYFPDLNVGTQSNGEGYYEFEHLPANGIVQVQVSYIGYKTQIIRLEINSPITTQDFSLQRVAMQTEEVVISGGAHSTQHNNPIKIEIIMQESLLTTSSLSFSEDLSRIPGVDMMSYGPAVSKPVIRGLSMTNILVLNNGVKLENFQFSENHPFIIDEFGSDRIEIVKGPASLLYGSDAVGGVINIIPEKPASVGKIIGDFGTKYFSNTHGIVSNFGLKGSSKQFSWGFRAGLKSHEDYLDGEGIIVPNTRFNEQIFKTNLAYRHKMGNVSIAYDYNRPKLGMSVKNVIPLITENTRKNEYWYQDLSMHLIHLKNRLYFNTKKLDVNAAYQMNNRRLQTDDKTPAFEMVNMDLNTLSWEIKSYLPFSHESEFVIGTQGVNKTNRNHEAPNRVIPDANVFDLAGLLYLNHPVKERLKTQIGMRYDYRNINTFSLNDEIVIDEGFSDISASVGATYKIFKFLLLRSNFATAYRTPNLAELTQDGVHGVRYEQGNPELNSQRSYEGDASIHLHSDWLMLDIAGFYHQINGYIFLSPTNDSLNDLRVYRYQQTNARLKGAEISMEFLPFEWLNLQMDYALIHAVQENQEYLPLIPHDKLNVNLRYQPVEVWKFKSVCLSLGGTYAFPQNHVSPTETKTDSYFIMNAGLHIRYPLGSQIAEFSVRITNIFDEMYIDHLSNIKEMGYFNMGRNIMLGISIPFSI